MLFYHVTLYNYIVFIVYVKHFQRFDRYYWNTLLRKPNTNKSQLKQNKIINVKHKILLDSNKNIGITYVVCFKIVYITST